MDLSRRGEQEGAAKRLPDARFKTDDAGKQHLNALLEAHQPLQVVYQFRMRLQAIWAKSSATQAELVVALQEWCRQAEETGISGITDIEVTKGLQSGDEIVVGSYKALRTLKPESSVKIDNSAPKKPEDTQS